jgi:hypothetical protein
MAVFYSIDRGERLTFGIMYDVMAHPPKWFLEVAQHSPLGVLIRRLADRDTGCDVALSAIEDS